MARIRDHGSHGRHTPICQVVVDLFDMRPGGAAVSLRMGEAGGRLPESREDREELAEALQREFQTALGALLLD